MECRPSNSSKLPTSLVETALDAAGRSANLEAELESKSRKFNCGHDPLRVCRTFAARTDQISAFSEFEAFFGF